MYVQIRVLSALGGTTVRSNITAIMSKLLSKELAMMFSYLGKKGKRRFSDLSLRDIVICKYHLTPRPTAYDRRPTTFTASL
jgi:hypothetical protein